MNVALEGRAVAAARAVADAHGLPDGDAAVIASGSNVLVHLRPTPVVARVMTGTVALHDDPRRWLEREVSVLSFLAPSGIAVAPSALITPGPHRHDDLWMIFTEWIPDVERPSELRDADRLGQALQILHDALRTFDGELGGMSTLRARIERLHARLEPSDRLAAERVASLRVRLAALDEAVFASALPTQALHGDVSLGNLLHTQRALVWNDFEDTLRGPVHWDVASYLISLRSRGASPRFIRRVLDAYGRVDQRELAPFTAAHVVYDEIWGMYDRQRRAGRGEWLERLGSPRRDPPCDRQEPGVAVSCCAELHPDRQPIGRPRAGNRDARYPEDREWAAEQGVAGRRQPEWRSAKRARAEDGVDPVEGGLAAPALLDGEAARRDVVLGADHLAAGEIFAEPCTEAVRVGSQLARERDRGLDPLDHELCGCELIERGRELELLDRRAGVRERGHEPVERLLRLGLDALPAPAEQPEPRSTSVERDRVSSKASAGEDVEGKCEITGIAREQADGVEGL